MNFREELVRFADQLKSEQNAAFDLWSWLPSHREAQRHHGDYASNHTPSVEDVLREAIVYLGVLRDNPAGTITDWPAVSDWFQCPCGEPHDYPTDG